MGKGKRVRALRADLKEKKKVEKAAIAKKQKIKSIAIASVALLVIVVLVGSLIWTSVYDARWRDGSIQRDTVVMKTEHYEVNAAMMSYYYYSTFNNALNANSSAFESAGLDTSAPLRSQIAENGTTTTWFDYFMSITQQTVSEYLYLAEKAHEKNMTLDAADKASIDDTIKAFSTAASSNGYDIDTYLSSYFGTGVHEQDVRDCLELATLADKFQKSYQDSLAYDDADLEAHYKENEDQYSYAEYHIYKITADNVEDEKSLKDAEKAANELADCKNAEEFEKWVEKKLRAEKKITEEYTEEHLKAEVASTHIKDAQYQETDSLKWLFEEAKAGETKVFDDDAGTFTVVLCDAVPARSDLLTKNIHYIYLDNETYDGEEGVHAKAKEAYEALKKAEFSDEAFKEAVSKYSEYVGSDETGLFENVTHNKFGAETNEWLFAADRKKGDCAILEGESYHVICHYIDDGVEEWKVECEATLRAKDYEKALTSWKNEIKITTNESGFDNVPDLGE